MKLPKPKIFVLTAFTFIAALLVPFSGKGQDTQAEFYKKLALLQKMVGRTAPSFTGTTLKGKELTREHLKGKIVVINFWFVGCPPCEEEMPLLNKLKDQYKKNSDIIFLSFATTSKEKVQKYLLKQQFKYETVPEAVEIANRYNVSAFPSNFIIDKEGIVRFTSIGGQDDIDTYLDEKIKEVIEQPSFQK